MTGGAAFALDIETRALEAPSDHADGLRLWLRILACANLIEGDLRRRLRAEFGVTLPRFDLMAQLERAPGGMTLSELSRRMMVSNGNLTALVERLVRSGHVTRAPSPDDRRAQIIRLTRPGRREFAALAAAHGGWIGEAFADLSARDTADLSRLVAKAKASARRAFDRRQTT